MSRRARLSWPSTWLCIELRVDGASGQVSTWVDGVAVTGLEIDGTSTPEVDEQWLRRPGWRPKVRDVRLGWESYAGQSMTLWFDDIAFGRERLGCL